MRKIASFFMVTFLLLSVQGCNLVPEASQSQCDLYEQSVVQTLNQLLPISDINQINAVIADKYQIPVENVQGPISFPDVGLTGYRWRLNNSELQYTAYFENETLERIQIAYPIEQEKRYTIPLKDILDCLGTPDYYESEITLNIDEFTHGVTLFYIEEQRVFSVLTTSDRPLTESTDSTVMLNWLRYAPASSLEELIEHVYGINDPAAVDDIMNSIQPWE